MNDQDYRSKLETHLMDKEAEMDKTTTYITVGLLGFFMTINDKFVPLLNSNLKIWMYISISSLILSLIIGLIYKYITVLFDGNIIRYIDDNDIENTDNYNNLTKLWEKYIKRQNCVKAVMYVFLGIGLVTEVIFSIYNFERKTKQKDNIIKVELVNSPKDSVLNIKVIGQIQKNTQIKKIHEKHQ